VRIGVTIFEISLGSRLVDVQVWRRPRHGEPKPRSAFSPNRIPGSSRELFSYSSMSWLELQAASRIPSRGDTRAG
jgi:hypothetical protein